MEVQVFPYIIVEEKPISDLIEFKDHNKLRVFYEKGTTCVSCGKIGTRLVLGKQKRGDRYHWNVYTDDYYPITVDHIIPKSLGGNDDLINLQPMCAGCNNKKGNGKPKNPKAKKRVKVPGLQKISQKRSFIVIGKLVYRKSGKNRQIKPLGIVTEIVNNPHTNKVSVRIEGNFRSFYDLESLYVMKDSLIEN